MQIIKPGEATWDVPLADETILDPLPQVPNMSENFCYLGHDAVSRVAFLVHIGRWIKDPEIFREMFIVWLPDGTVMWAHAFGRGDCTLGPSVACSRLICEEPGKRIRIRYSGPMQPIPPDQIVNPTGFPNSLDKVDIDLVFEGASPTYYYPQTENTTWSKWHTEQLGKVRGTVRHIDRKFDFNGVGYRDHSRGPRYLKDFRGHSWIQGHFPGGDSFNLYQMWQIVDGVEKQALSEAHIHQNGELIPARVVSSPRLTSTAGIVGDYELVLESKLGTMNIIGKPRGLAFFSYGTLMSHFFPSVPIGNTEFFMTTVEQPSVFSCAGRDAVGHTERSFYRGDADKIFDPAAVESFYAR